MKTKVLVLGVHSDDMECGVGGTARLLADAGCEVTFGWLTSPYHEGLASPQKSDSVALLGLKQKVNRFVNARDALLYGEDTIEAYKEIIEEADPDIAFIMWPKDNHIEHVHAAKAQLDALYRSGSHVKEIYAYEVGPLQDMCLFGEPDLSIDISSVIGPVKEVLYHYEQNDSPWLWEEKEVSDRFRGHMSYAQVNGYDHPFTYAEAFRIVKMPDGGDDFLLRTILRDYFRWGGTGVYYRGREYYL